MPSVGSPSFSPHWLRKKLTASRLVVFAFGSVASMATPEAIFDFYYERGFHLTRLTTDSGGSGINQFVFCRGDDA